MALTKGQNSVAAVNWPTQDNQRSTDFRKKMYVLRANQILGNTWNSIHNERVGIGELKNPDNTFPISGKKS
jgi:hypothetical protein